MGRRRLDRKPGSTAIQHKERHRQSGVGASCGKVVALGAQKEEGVETTKPSNSKVNGGSWDDPYLPLTPPPGWLAK